MLRIGGVLPTLMAIFTLVVLRITGGDRTQLAIAVGAVTVVGQAMVWSGLLGLRAAGNRCASGAGFYLWVGGVLSAQTLFLTGVPAVMPIPLAAPLVATVARWRMRRGAAAGGGGS